MKFKNFQTSCPWQIMTYGKDGNEFFCRAVEGDDQCEEYNCALYHFMEMMEYLLQEEE